MIFYKLDTAPVDHFVHLPMLIVSIKFFFCILVCLLTNLNASSSCFAEEISAVRDLGPDHTTDLAAILSSALPPSSSSQNQHIPVSIFLKFEYKKLMIFV